MKKLIRFCLENKLVVLIAVTGLIIAGIMVAPFDWEMKHLPRYPVAVDAIPDLGENQQIIFTRWPGRSPQDVEDQITYPLTVSLLGSSPSKSKKFVLAMSSLLQRNLWYLMSTQIGRMDLIPDLPYGPKILHKSNVLACHTL